MSFSLSCVELAFNIRVNVITNALLWVLEACVTGLAGSIRELIGRVNMVYVSRYKNQSDVDWMQ